MVPLSVTPTSVTLATNSVLISTTPQTIRMELVPGAVPEPTSALLAALAGLPHLTCRRRSGADQRQRGKSSRMHTLGLEVRFRELAE